jgi:glycosyltransferase involved in cell wall biosynthesis
MHNLVFMLFPVFNARACIAETIESALQQTWPREETIVLDDGSLDGKFSIASGFGSKAVQVLSQPSQDAAAARNRALHNLRSPRPRPASTRQRPCVETTPARPAKPAA